MRTLQVQTNMTCNQNCTYCTRRAASEDRAFVSPVAVRGRIDAAIDELRRGGDSGARELVLTGGEPTLRSDLASLVRHAHARDVRVLLQTNATLVNEAMAIALREAGLQRAIVNLVGTSDRVDRITRDEGGMHATLRGISALRTAGIAVEIAAVVVRSSRPLLAALPAALVKALGERPVEAIRVTVPTASPNLDELVSYEEAAETILALDAEARRVGIPVKLDPHSGPPPCVFPTRTRPTHLYAMTSRSAAPPATNGAAPVTNGATSVHIEACERCIVRDRCSGFSREYLATRGAPQLVEPITEERVRRRLTLLSTTEEQIARELVTPNRYHDGDGKAVDEEVIRVNFHCNQVCRFCFVSTHLPPAGDVAVRNAIVAAAERGVKITLSGGEPTLNANLVEYVGLATARGRLPVLLQTNAVRLDDASLAQSLFDAGLREAFVSLHGSNATIGDAVTGAPGTYDRSLVGIDNLCRLGVSVVLNFVLCEANYRDLPDFVRMVARRFPASVVNVSFVAPSTDVVPRDRELVPRYSDVLPFVGEAMAIARTLGLVIGGFESMCGIPLCLVPSELESFVGLTDVPPGYDGGEFVKTDACARCDLSTRCFGLRRGYVELHGAGELRPRGPRPYM